MRRIVVINGYVIWRNGRPSFHFWTSAVRKHLYLPFITDASTTPSVCLISPTGIQEENLLVFLQDFVKKTMKDLRSISVSCDSYIPCFQYGKQSWSLFSPHSACKFHSLDQQSPFNRNMKQVQDCWSYLCLHNQSSSWLPSSVPVILLFRREISDNLTMTSTGEASHKMRRH